MDSSSCSCKISLILSLVLAFLVVANGVPSHRQLKVIEVNGIPAHPQMKVFDVRKFGFVADGKTDNSKALLHAWNKACHYQGRGRRRVYIPPGNYVTWPVVLKGPCTGPITFTVKGVVKAPVDSSTFSLDHWITFQYIDGLLINGGGTFDGQGEHAWHYNKCACKSLPVSLRFNFVNNTLIRSISSVNSKNFHFNIFNCHGLEIRGVKIIAPDESPNTDGIHIGDSSDISISDSVISTGDDCISIGPGSRDVEVVGVLCGPGHGISVGSLGKYKNEDDVTGLSVRRCTMTGTENGVRIKTWGSAIKSRAYNFTFHDITMKNVRNPIIIDQEYCPMGGCSKETASNVQIKDVWFSKIRGTSATQVAVNLICSPTLSCKNINLENINLAYTGHEGPEKSHCSHVEGIARHVERPESCI